MAAPSFEKHGLFSLLGDSTYVQIRDILYGGVIRMFPINKTVEFSSCDKIY
jgi:hypothetical protein